ncbi:Cyclin [Entamoeba marina]
MQQVQVGFTMQSAFVPMSIYFETSNIYICPTPNEEEAIPSDFVKFCRYLQEKQTQMPLPDLKIATPVMRPQLVNWLFDMCNFLKFPKKTFFHSLSLVDLYTTRKNVSSDELGLIFVTALFSVAKYDALPIKLSDVQNLCGQKYCKSAILNMERLLLHSVNYKMDNPTPFDFLHILWEVSDYPPYSSSKRNHPVVEASINFLQMMAYDPNFSTSSPSSVAACAFFFARDFCHFAKLWGIKYQKCLMLRRDDVKESALDFVEKMKCCMCSGSQNCCRYKTVQEFVIMINNHLRSKNCNCGSGHNSKKECYWHSNNISCFD